MKEELEHKNLKTWEGIKYFKDIISESEEQIIQELNFENQCEHLSHIDNFYYCCAGLNKNLEAKAIQEKPAPENIICKRQLSVIEIQLFCIGPYNKCLIYKGEMPAEKI